MESFLLISMLDQHLINRKKNRKTNILSFFYFILNIYLHVILFLNQIKIPVYHDEIEDVVHVVKVVQDIRTLDVELD
jgi:hypothetical protein